MVSKEVLDNFEEDFSQYLLETTVPAMTTSCAHQHTNDNNT